METLDSTTAGVDYRMWIMRVVCWDGLLPIAVSLISIVVAAAFPKNKIIAESLMVGLPVVAVFVRFSLGVRHIRANSCGAGFRFLQTWALGLAVLIFMFADFLIVLSAFVPKGRRNPPTEDIPIYVIGLLVYLICVVTAMYPGRGCQHQRVAPTVIRSKLCRRARATE